MDKENITWVLQACLLAVDGVSEQEQIEDYGVPEASSKIGIKLCDYLLKK